MYIFTEKLNKCIKYTSCLIQDGMYTTEGEINYSTGDSNEDEKSIRTMRNQNQFRLTTAGFNKYLQ